MRFSLLLFTILLLPVSVSAQGFSVSGQQDNLLADPAFPEPGQTVAVTINDYSGGLFGSQITWRFNGETVPDSINQRSVEIVAGDLGTNDTVEAVFTTPSGRTETMTIGWKPTYLDIILEPQVRVPSWYQGRGMPSTFSQVIATAVVNDGTVLNPNDLVYKWQVGETVIDAGPVRGRNKIEFQTPRGNEFFISLTVSRASGGAIASKIETIEIAKPLLHFYEQHPLYGSSQFPITEQFPLIGNTVKILAEPYNLDTRVYNDPDVALWEINSIETSNGTRNPYEITLQQAAASGRTNVNFHVRSLQTILQGAEDNITIQF